MKKIIFALVLLGVLFLLGCSTLTPSEKIAWDKYFKAMEKTHQIDTAFLLGNPKN